MEDFLVKLPSQVGSRARLQYLQPEAIAPVPINKCPKGISRFGVSKFYLSLLLQAFIQNLAFKFPTGLSYILSMCWNLKYTHTYTHICIYILIQHFALFSVKEFICKTMGVQSGWCSESFYFSAVSLLRLLAQSLLLSLVFNWILAA